MIYCIVANDVAREGAAVPGLSMIEFGVVGPPVAMLYHGRPVWPSYALALRYLRQARELERAAVWALDADWESDTWQYGFEDFRRTLRTLALCRVR